MDIPRARAHFFPFFGGKFNSAIYCCREREERVLYSKKLLCNDVVYIGSRPDMTLK